MFFSFEMDSSTCSTVFPACWDESKIERPRQMTDEVGKNGQQKSIEKMESGFLDTSFGRMFSERRKKPFRTEAETKGGFCMWTLFVIVALPFAILYELMKISK